MDSTNLDGSTPTSEILQADWPREGIFALFADLAAGATVDHVQLRTSSSDATVGLEQARAAFASGEAVAIQIRYRFDGEAWSDTILPGDPTSRIIRGRLPASPG